MNAFVLAISADTASAKVRTNGACLHFSVAPAGTPKNQLGMQIVQTAEEFGKVFVRFAQKADVKGKLVCFTDKQTSESF
jgi:hypothetical protein